MKTDNLFSRILNEDLAQVQEDHTFIAQTNEFADIANGTSTLTDSITDGVLPLQSGDDATAAAGEAQSAEAQTESANAQWHKTVLEHIKHQIKMHGSPDVYLGNGWGRAW
jgi:hypothetical protein